jgi:hypothetical protein
LEDTQPRPSPPRDLKKRGKSLWRSVIQVYRLDPAELELLHEMGSILDEIDRLSAVLADSEPIVKGHAGQPRPHPLIGEIREHRKLVDKLAAALALPLPGEQIGRRRSPEQKSAAQSRWTRQARLGGE